MSIQRDNGNSKEQLRFRLCPAIFHGNKDLYPYKVGEGDSLKNIAEAIGVPWEEIAILNWGTDDPDEINDYLGKYFVCTKKVGANYVFSDDDTPGILLLPRPMDPTSFKHTRRIRASRFVPKKE